MTHNRRTHVGLGCLILALTAGCGLVGAAGEDQWTAPLPPGSSAAPGRTNADPDALVRRVVLTDADLIGGATVQLLEAGDVVAGQVTLDLCGLRFRSEAHRTARYQVDVVPAGDPDTDPTSISNEVVAYDTATHAAAALDEWRTAVARCPRNVWRDVTVAGVPDLKYDLLRERPDRRLPAADNSVTTFAVSVRDSAEHLHALIILQGHGTVLNVIHALSLKPLTAPASATAIRLATITGRRLIALT